MISASEVRYALGGAAVYAGLSRWLPSIGPFPVEHAMAYGVFPLAHTGFHLLLAPEPGPVRQHALPRMHALLIPALLWPWLCTHSRWFAPLFEMPYQRLVYLIVAYVGSLFFAYSGTTVVRTLMRWPAGLSHLAIALFVSGILFAVSEQSAAVATACTHENAGQINHLYLYPFIYSTLRVACVLLLMNLVFNHLLRSLLIMAVGVAAIYSIHVAKSFHLRSPLSWSDTHLISEGLVVAFDFIGIGILVTFLAMIAVLGTAWYHVPLRLPLGVPQRTLALIYCLALALPLSWDAHAWELSLQGSGLLVHLLHTRKLEADLLAMSPPNYQASAAAILESHAAIEQSHAPGPDIVQPNVFIYLIESFVPPTDLGLETTASATPNIDRLGELPQGRRSQLVVPVFGGLSGNTEFEVLTGLSTSALPEGYVAYHYVRRPLPALPTALRATGYRTAAIFVDSRHLFDRPRVLPLLGFDEVDWLDECKTCERSVAGFTVSDHELALRCRAAIRRGGKQFLHAFPNSTHGPYHPDPRDGERIKITGPPALVADQKAWTEAMTYVNRLLDADKQFGLIVDEIQSRPEPWLVLVMGDHRPPLAWVYQHLDAQQRVFPAKHTVRLTLWSNSSAVEMPSLPDQIGANFVRSIVDRLCCPHYGLAQEIIAAAREDYDVLGRNVRASRSTEWRLPLSTYSTPFNTEAAYRLLTYDLLLGEGQLSEAPHK